MSEDASNQSSSSATAHNLAGANTGYRTFVAGAGDAAEVVYRAYEIDADGNPAGAWELCVGTVTDATPDTLSRTTLIASSSGSFINWTSVGSAPRLELVAPGETMLAPLTRVEQSGSGAASFDFLGLEAGFSYLLELERVSGVANSTTLALWMRMRRAGQPSFDSGATDYEYHGIGYGAGSFAAPASTGASAIALTNGTHYGTGSAFSDSGTYISGEMLIHVPQDAVRCRVDWRVGYGANGGAGSIFTGWGYRDSDAAVQGVQMLFSTGDIEGKAVLRRLPRVR